MTWVVLNHFIEYKSPAFEKDVLEIETWVTSMEGVKSERRVEIRRKSNQKIIIKAQTLWCLVDRSQLHPKRIPEELKTIFLQKGDDSGK